MLIAHRQIAKRALCPILWCQDPSIGHADLAFGRIKTHAHPPDQDYNDQIDGHDNKVPMAWENYHPRAENGQNAESMTCHPNHQARRFWPPHDCDNAADVVEIVLPQPAGKTADLIVGGSPRGETSFARMTFSSLSIV